MAKNKNPVPMVSGGGGLFPKLAGWLVALVVVVLVVKQPSESATWTKSAFNSLGSAVEGLGTFLGLVLS